MVHKVNFYYGTPGDDLDDHHLVNVIVYLVNEYKKAK